MKFTTKTEYGLICLIYMVRNHTGQCVTTKDIIRREHFSPTYIEKILQKLRAANIVTSHQGKDGGFSLARSPSEITLKEIIEALEGQTFNIYCKPGTRKDIVCTHHEQCSVRPVWRKTKALLDDFFESVTLEAIAKEELEVQNIFS